MMRYSTDIGPQQRLHTDCCVPMWLRLGGRLAGAVPGSLLMPFADRSWPPDRLSADTAVSLRHLLACNVGTRCGWGDAEKARNVAGCPPVLGKRVNFGEYAAAWIRERVSGRSPMGLTGSCNAK
jgi:hypothetical protein